MLVLKGNAFYEIDEDCMRRKGLKFPEEQDQALPPKAEAGENILAQKYQEKRKTAVFQDNKK